MGTFREWIINKLGGNVGLGYGRSVNKELAPGIRVGSWVVWEGKIGISHPGIDGLVEVHLVNDKGETYLQTLQPVSALRKARVSEIPESRRPDKVTANRLGYGG